MSRQKQKIYNLNMHPLPRPQVPPQRDKLEFVGLKKMLSLRTQTEACHCEPVRTLARNDMFYFSAINTNLSYRTDTCPALVRAAGG